MYSGNMGLSQRLDVIIGTAECLSDDDDILFLLVGNGANRQSLEETVSRKKLANIRFFDYQPRDTLSHSLSAADLQLIFLAPDLQKYLMPSKLYSILAAGVNILALADNQSELALTIENEGVGVVYSDNNPYELARVIKGIAKSRGKSVYSSARARQLAVDRFDRTLAVHRFARILTHDNDNTISNPETAPHQLEIELNRSTGSNALS